MRRLRATTAAAVTVLLHPGHTNATGGVCALRKIRELRASNLCTQSQRCNIHVNAAMEAAIEDVRARVTAALEGQDASHDMEVSRRQQALVPRCRAARCSRAAVI
jgi:hypothetical protein